MEEYNDAIQPIGKGNERKIHNYRVTYKALGTIEMTDNIEANGLNEALEKALEISKAHKWHVDRIDRI